MARKFVSQLDKSSLFICPVEADQSPLEPGVYLIPAGAVDIPPPTIPNGMQARYNGSGFDFEEVPPQPEPQPEPPEPTPLELAQKARANAYQEESDPLFFKWQRGESTKEEWLAKVEGIKAAYPYPEAT